MMRQPVGVGVERGVAQRAVLEHHRDRIRRAHGLRRKQRRQGRGRNRRARCRSSPAGWCRAPPRPGSPARRARGPASATAASSSRISRRPALPRSPRRTGRWRIPARRRSRPARRRRAAARSARPTGRTSRSRSRSARRHRKPRQLQRAGAGLARLKRQHHLEQRMPRQRPRRVEHLDQPLERQLLVAIGRKVAAPHPADQLTEARVARGVGAQHQRVDEEPDQIVQRRIAAARDRAADRDVGAGAKPLSSPARPACSTMNRLDPVSRASAASATVQIGRRC